MRDLTYRAVNAVGRVALGALAVDIRAHGLDRLPRTGPVLLASTHGSYLDFVMLEHMAVRRGRYLRFLARYDAWVPGPLAWVLDAMGHVPVDRAAPAAAYLRSRRLLRDGEAVCVFPEAGISHALTVRALMPGVAALSRDTGVPVLPVATWGAQRISTVGDPNLRPDLTRGRVVDVSIGAPFTVPRDGDPIAWTGYLGTVLTGMLEELQTLPHHRPVAGEPAPWHPAHLGGTAPNRVRGAELDELPFSAVPPTW